MRRLLVGLAVAAWAVAATGAARADGWSIQSLDVPYAGVSCPTASDCEAVGSEFEHIGPPFVASAAGWNGTSWEYQQTPDLVGVTNDLNGVSCASGGVCIAVGDYLVTAQTSPTVVEVDQTLAEAWNGTAWSAMTTPNPSDGTSEALDSVSCPSASNCTAVGSYTTTTGDTLTLAEHWDGTSWQIEPTPNPTGATDASLDSVSCPTARYCAAVGGSLAERWNGTSWKIEPTPAGSNLVSVSCPIHDRCMATGGALVEHWNGSGWKIKANIPTVAGLDLTAVSCPTRRICTAVGSDAVGNGLVALRKQGQTWTVQTLPDLGTFSVSPPFLTSVSCADRTVCTALGVYTQPPPAALGGSGVVDHGFAASYTSS